MQESTESPTSTREPDHRGARLAVVFAVVGLLLAAVALARDVFDWRLGAETPAATGPTASAGPANPVPGNPASSVPPPTATSSVRPRSPATPPKIDAQAVYEPEYENQSLTLKTADCFKKMQVDLDDPRANVGSDASEMSLDPGCQGGAPWIRLDGGVEGSEAAAAGMKPGECYDAIRTSPIAEGAEVPLRKGSWLCVRTNFQTASAQRDDWRIVLVEVVSLGNDRAVVIRATAWNIPKD
ncbi:hypothetical protein [Micromonospora sp. NPDC048839]|uniref:hypothetical protein n=1 Tax=Micromonospora sp. NPDC048839 TaxID=3155641 RepID=UPI0033C9DE84